MSQELLINTLELFNTEVMLKLAPNTHILVIPRVKLENGEFITLSKMLRLNKDDIDFLRRHLLNAITIKTDGYFEIPIVALSFDYNVVEGLAPKRRVELIPKKNQTYYHYKLPASMNPFDYGGLSFQVDNQYVFQLPNSNLAIIKVEKNKNIVSILRNGDLLLQYEDLKINDNTFIRKINKNSYTFVDNEVKFVEMPKKTKYFSVKKAKAKINEKIITMDLETQTVDNKLIPYCVGVYTDSKKKHTFYLSDFDSPDSMIKAAINKIFIKRYKNYHVYIHNLSNFDGIFLLKTLTAIGYTSPVINDNRIISIDLHKDDCKLTFLDSYQLLPSSLKKLAKNFNVSNKGIFPYHFLINTDTNINYIGNVPDIKYFPGLTELEYKEYCSQFKNKDWNLRLETEKYCLQDCISLFEVISKFNSMIFSLFQLNIVDYPTLPSLSFAIYKTRYMKKDVIAQISGKIDKDIRKSYTGGAVDAYIPEGENVFCYDVNSLYPYVMSKFDMPVGSPTFFHGDITKYQPDAFGFFKVEVTCPENLQHPIIQCHLKTENGIRTVAGTGTFETMIFSEEMHNAKKYGYTFKVLEGYTFQRANIFDSFISNLYSIRKSYSKSDPMNLVAKLLMNSLYGRFGMDDAFEEIVIIPKESYPKFESMNIDAIRDITQLDEDLLIKFRDPKTDENNINYTFYETHNTNVAIASAITAYARIHMSQFKNNPDYILYYSDTDSIYISKRLPAHLVSDTELGLMKLEYICKKAIFIAPKVYCVLTEDNKFIFKVKGLISKVNLTMSDFESLLIKDTVLEKTQDKWFKSIENAEITVKSQLYSLKVTASKRELVYNENNKLVATKPINISGDNPNQND